MNKGWIGVDFDGTLAHYETWEGADVLGKPIPAMVKRVKEWLANGDDVRIMTARVYSPPDDAIRQNDAARALLAIQVWCSLNFGAILPVTCTKDFSMIEMWDDRCIQVERNIGIRVDGKE